MREERNKERGVKDSSKERGEGSQRGGKVEVVWGRG